jgi:membrane AbrB-like protein
MIKKLSILFLVAITGTTIAKYLNFPLPFFMGPVLSVMILSLSGFTFKIPEIVWTVTRVVIGIYLASKLSPSIVGDVIKWSGSFVMQFLLIILSIFILSLFYRKFCNFDLPTSISSSTPGGATAVFLISEDLGKIDVHKHFITHLSRMFFIVTILPFSIQFYLSQSNIVFEKEIFFDLKQFILILIVSLSSAFIMKKLRSPSPYFLGPVIGCGTLYISGSAEIIFPDIGLNFCLLVVGCFIGSRFQNYKIHDFISNLKFSICGIILIFFLMIVFAYVSHLIFDLDFLALIISYCPGGIYEMTGMALAFNYEPDFVLAHHIVRLFTIIFCMPFIMKYAFKNS